MFPDPKASAGACDGQAGLELPLPPGGSTRSAPLPRGRGLRPRSVSLPPGSAVIVSLPAACRGPQGRPSGRGRSVTTTKGGHRLGAPFSQGSPSSGPGGAWGLGASCSLSPLSEGARRCCLPWASSGWWGGCPPCAPRAWPPLPCLLLALLTPHPRDVCGASASGGHGCCFPDICRLRFQAAFPPGSPFRFLRPCLPCQAWRGSAGIISSEPGSAVTPSPGSWMQPLQPVSSRCRPPRGASLSRGA